MNQPNQTEDISLKPPLNLKLDGESRGEKSITQEESYRNFNDFLLGGLCGFLAGVGVLTGFILITSNECQKEENSTSSPSLLI